MLYRLAASPGRRALLGMPAREGRLIRPLLDCTPRRGDGLLRRARADLARGPHQQRSTSPATASATGLLPALRALHPAADANILRTLEILRDEAKVLDARSPRPSPTSTRWPPCRPRSRA